MSTNWRRLDTQQNLEELIRHMPEDQREEWQTLGHTTTEAAFYNRKLYVIKTKGRSNNTGIPKQPDVLGVVKVAAFSASLDAGCTMMLIDTRTSETMLADHTPRRLFDWPIYVSIPISQGVIWGCDIGPNGEVQRALMTGICWKQQSALKFVNRNNVSLTTANVYTKLFGPPPD